MLESLLALDTLIVAAALGPAVRGWRHGAVLALLFGAFDALGSAVHGLLPASSALAPFGPPALFAYGCLVLFLAARGAEVRHGLLLVPALLALDNLAAGGAPGWAFGASVVAAVVGLAAGRWVARRLDDAYRMPDDLTLAGGALCAAAVVAGVA